MKRVIVLVFVILFAFCCFAACSGKAPSEQGSSPALTEAPTQAPTPAPTPSPTPTPKWYVYQPKDEFGDPVPNGKKSVDAEFTGTYSNLKTGSISQSAKMLAYYNKDLNKFMFNLSRNGVTYEEFRTGQTVTCKFKIGEEKYSAVLYPVDYYLHLSEEIFGEKVSANEGIINTLEQAFLNNSKIACVIEYDSVIFRFDIDGSGFKEACNEVYP